MSFPTDQGPGPTTWAAWAPNIEVCIISKLGRAPAVAYQDIAPSDGDRHPQPNIAVHSTRHCVVITSGSAPVMAAPPATDGDHLRLNYVPESAPPGLRFRGARGGRPEVLRRSDLGRPRGPSTPNPGRFRHPTGSDWPLRCSGVAICTTVLIQYPPFETVALGHQSLGSRMDDPLSGSPAGRRQASRGGSTVSHDWLSLSDAQLYRSVPSYSS